MGKRRRKRVKVQRRNRPVGRRGARATPVSLPQAHRVIVGASPYAGASSIYDCIQRLADVTGIPCASVVNPGVTWQPGRATRLHLIQLSDIRRDLLPAVVLTITRNLLDSVASAVVAESPLLDSYLRHGLGDEKAVTELDNFVALSYDWARLASVVIRFESLVVDREWHVRWLGEMLMSDHEFDAAIIADEMVEAGLDVPIGCWKDVLEPDLADFIRTTYANWFVHNEYKIEA